VAQKTSPHGASEVLDGLETRFERVVRFVAAHPLAVGLTIVGVLAAGGGWEWRRTTMARSAAAASNELDRVQTAYLAAMGADAGAIEVPKLANPDAEKRIREEYVEKYRAVATAHPGSVAAALAWLEVANLLQAGGDAEGALASLQTSLAEQSANPRLAGLAHQRIAQLHEERGDLVAAAAEHEAAGGLPEFPLRYLALADAARCYAQIGKREQALALLERVESEGQDSYPLPGHLRSLLRELRSAQAP
jgi:predicted negative regulator of RcsB-dependent stress response